MFDILYVVYAVVVVLAIGWLSIPDSDPILGVYSQPNKYYFLKFRFIKLMLWLRRRKNKNAQNAPEGTPGYGLRSKNAPELMEVIQDLPENQPLAVDAVYFNGGNAEGQYFVVATARRLNNIIQTILYLRIPDIGLFEIPSKPDTRLQATKPDVFAVAGIEIVMIEPMKTWKITYKGKLRLTSTGELHDANLDLMWTATTPFFDFDTDLHPDAMAEAIAREKWSRKFFDVLKMIHQTHYEQFGRITGSVKIDGFSDMSLNVHGVRDHSYGKIRDWRFFYRYNITYASLADETSLCIGAICMPLTMSRLIIGYVIHPDGQVDPVSSTDFEFYNDGENGEPKVEHAYRFVAGGKHYNLKLNVLDAPVFYIGEGRDAKIHERMCKFNVNGVKGWGISEYDYRNVEFSDKLA